MAALGHDKLMEYFPPFSVQNNLLEDRGQTNHASEKPKRLGESL